jgi:short subunit dehydrogenase-like uncharacterized protein
MRRVIVLYGATGYTGRIVTRELAERGDDFVLGGRSRDKLERLSAELGAGAPVRVASVDDDASLQALLDGADVVINCAGPFSLAGEPVVRAAVAAGVHYVDSTGEQPFIRTVFERYGGAAERKGIVLIPACGFDYVPGDCAARLAARGHEPLDELAVAYAVNEFGLSRGTMRSALEMMKGTDSVQYRDGDWRPHPTGVVRATFDFGPPIGRVPVSPSPAGEPITVPRHTDVRTVTALLATQSVVPPAMVPLAPFTMPVIGRLTTGPVKKLVNRAIDRLPEGPPEDERRAVTWTVVAAGRSRDGAPVRATVRGTDVYGMTARSLAWAAEQIAAGDHHGAGALGPAAAFDPEDLLGALADFGVEWDADARPAAVL